MQNRENDIQFTVWGQNFLAVPGNDLVEQLFSRLGEEHHWQKMRCILAFQSFQDVLAGHPGTRVGDADLGNLIFCRVQHREDRARGHERYLMFARTSAEKNTQTQLTCHDPFFPFRKGLTELIVQSPSSSTSSSSLMPNF